MSRNTNAYLNALHQEHKRAVSNAFSAAENAARKILHASGTVKHIHPTIYDPASEKIARNALYDASNASWKALLAASKTYQKGNVMTKEKQAAQKIYELQKKMRSVTTNMDRFMNPLPTNNKSALRNTVHRGVLQAKTNADNARETWEQLSQKTNAEGGRRTRRNRNKKSHRSRRSHCY
jgi:hypothetical protein